MSNATDLRCGAIAQRVEGHFARIERWTRSGTADVHWRSISPDNVLTIYGTDLRSRIADPADPGRIFTWLVCEMRDDRGNAVVYEYKSEDGERVDLTLAHERNRGEPSDVRRSVNRYLKSIRYGNRTSLLDDSGHRPRWLTDAQIDSARWMFQVVFDYGEHDRVAPGSDDRGPWQLRDDPFSTYRAGFEVRTARLCRYTSQQVTSIVRMDKSEQVQLAATQSSGGNLHIFGATLALAWLRP